MSHFKNKIPVWIITLLFCLSQTLLATGVPTEFNPDHQATTDPSQNASSDGSGASASQTTTEFLEAQNDPLSPSDEDTSGAGSSVVTIEQITLSGNGRNQIIDPDLGLSVPTLNLAELSEITIEFDNASAISQDDLILRGWMNGTYTFSTFQVNGNEATWTLAAPITKDQVLLTFLSASYQLRFNVLPSDLNRDGAVNGADYVVWRKNLGWQAETNPADGNQDGRVDQMDFDFWKSHFGETGTAPVPGDYNGDGTVDAADYVVWRKNFGWDGTNPADINQDGIVDQNDYNLWRGDFGTDFSDPHDFAPIGSVTIENGATHINSADVTLSLNVLDDLTDPENIQMAFSQDGGMTFSDLEAFNTEKQLTLTGGDGAKEIIVRFRDDAGNIYEIFDSITLDRVAPVKNDGYQLIQDFRFSSPDGRGSVIAMNEKYIAIGTHEGGVGVVNLYDRNGTLLRTIPNPKPSSASYNEFGEIIALGDNRIVVGARNDGPSINTFVGAVYLYDFDGNLIRTISNPNPTNYDYFGSEIAIHGNTIVIGVPGENFSIYNDSGVVYLYDLNGNLLRTISNPAPQSYDNFGRSVAIYGTTIAIGANDANYIGNVRLYDLNGNLLRTILNPTPAGSDFFGSNLIIYGDKIVIGAIRDDTGNIDTGSAYVYDLNGNLIRTISNPDPDAEDLFGSGVAMNDISIMVGAFGDDSAGAHAGAVYIFDLDGNLIETVPGSFDGHGFGRSIQVHRTRMIVGGETYVGQAFYYTLIPGIQINFDDQVTESPEITLRLFAMDNFTAQPNLQMSFSQDGINFTPYEPFMETKQITLEGGDGEKTVYVRFRDEAENVSEFSDTIILQQSGGGSLSSASVELLNQTAPSSKDDPLRAPLNWQAMTLNSLTDQKKIETDSNLESKPRKSHRFREHRGSHLKRK